MRKTALTAFAALAACRAEQPQAPEPPAAQAAGNAAAAARTAPGDASAHPCRVQDGTAVAARLKALGTEPFWAAEVDGRCVTYRTPGNQAGTRVWARFSGAGANGQWSGFLGTDRFLLVTRAEPGCSDGMSDRRYPLAASLTVGTEQLRGCAEPLGSDRLRPDGKGLGEGLPFGSTRRDVLAAAARLRGSPTGQDRIEECGEGPMEFVRYGGLSLAFQQDRLVGWFVRAPDRLPVASGLKAGDPIGKLGKAAIEETTLGAEFELPDGTRGLLDEKRQKVEALWGGLACLFR